MSAGRLDFLPPDLYGAPFPEMITGAEGRTE
jgi:hypothetical protein